jgi:hypothetical protein
MAFVFESFMEPLLESMKPLLSPTTVESRSHVVEDDGKSDASDGDSSGSRSSSFISSGHILPYL